MKVIKPLDFIVPTHGSAVSLDISHMSEEEFDNSLTVYRFFLPKRAKLFLTFMINGSEEYKVSMNMVKILIVLFNSAGLKTS